MANLLPEEYQKETRRRYEVRLIILYLFFLATTGLITAVFLTPTILAINGETRSLLKQKDSLEKETPELKNLAEMELAASQLKKNLSALKKTDTALFMEAISRVIKGKNQRIKVQSMSYRNKEGEIEVALRGEAATRESLIDFVKTIENTETFSKVNLPVSDLAKDKDVSFSITFSII